MSLPWPLRGAIDFATTPRWWGLPLLALAAVMVLCLGLALGLGWLCLPPEGADWWTVVWRWCLAICVGLGAFAGSWLILQPILLALAFESVVLAAQRAAGAPPVAGENLLRGLASSLRVILTTLPQRLLTTAASFLGPLVAGPFGLILAAVLISRISLFDACEVSLAVRGIPGGRRLAILAAHRGDLNRVLLPAAAGHLLLAVPVLGWILWLVWLPGLLVGAARTVLTWDEVRERPVPPVSA